MNIDTDQIRKQIVIREGHRDQTLIIEQEEEDTEEIDHKVYIYNLYLFIYFIIIAIQYFVHE